MAFGRPLAAVLLSVILAACRASPTGSAPAIVQPGAPGEPGREVSGDQARGAARGIPHTAADVRFMQMMIAHHEQALRMADMAPARTEREAIRKLALRIGLSQADEIRMMEEWLDARGEDRGSHGHHAHEGPMPGMLSADEMDRLARAEGSGFDRLFLEFMIRHHEGALVMVRDLFAHPGAGEEPEIFAFASDVEADQRMEIRRMRAMLAEPGS